MAAYTGPEAVAHLTDLFTSAVDLIKRGDRYWYETKALYAAMQLYKNKQLGRVLPKLSSEECGEMFCEAMRGSRREYERLVDSLTEFGVDEWTIQKLKSVESLMDLGHTTLQEFFKLVSGYPMEHLVRDALRQIQTRAGLETPVYIPAIESEEKEKLKKLAETLMGPPQK